MSDYLLIVLCLLVGLTVVSSIVNVLKAFWKLLEAWERDDPWTTMAYAACAVIFAGIGAGQAFILVSLWPL